MNLAPPFPPKRTEWFEKARYGLFIHWGLYSVLGHGEWAMSREQIPLDEYKQLVNDFTADEYNPCEWAALAKEAGMRYAVLTTKHHEGFCLWNSKTCSFNSVNSPAKRDLVAEYVDAFRSAGLKVGVYYSLGDWYNQDWSLGWQGDKLARERFMDYTHSLLREIMTGYGPIDLLFYDLPQCYSSAEWKSVELNAAIRQWQPQIVINNRALTSEDYSTPEQHITPAAPGRLWESNMTLNQNWGWVPSDPNYKSPRQVAINLSTVAASAGNLLLNVGPTGTGRIPEQSVNILREVGKWLQRNGSAIYESERHQMTWNLWGCTSRRGNNIYMFLANLYETEMIFGGLENKVLSARLLGGPELTVKRDRNRWRIQGLPAIPPDPLLSVIELTVDGEPKQNLSTLLGGADIFASFPN